MTNALAMRASDADREQVVTRLRTAMVDGRLTTEEYADRVGLAYRAATLGDLEPLEADLPGAVPGLAADLPGPSARPAGPIARPGTLSSLLALLRVLWAIWLAAVSVNIVVWALVSMTTGNLLYPWPLWVAGPYGAALFALSAVVLASRKPSGP